MNLLHAVRTHVGLVRAHNEDASVVIPGHLYAVADGMGGHAAGEVASQIAVDHLREWSRGSIPREIAGNNARGVLTTCFNACHNRLCDHMRDHPETTGMGTTLTALVVDPRGSFYVAHVGDSRLYWVRDGRCDQVTEDHAHGHMITNALGCRRRDSYYGPDVVPEEGSIAIRSGDLFVVCTDGLANYADASDVGAVVRAWRRSGRLLDALADEFIQHARDSGGHDNVTVIVVEAVS